MAKYLRRPTYSLVISILMQLFNLTEQYATVFTPPSEELVSPVLVSNEGSSQLDIVAGVGLELAHRGATLFDHVEKHLGQLRVLVQIHQVGKTVVHFEGHSCFLITQSKNYL